MEPQNVQFVGIPWEPRCLDFHRADRSVMTASKWQVRQKINKSSVERWRNYEKFIAPLLSPADQLIPGNAAGNLRRKSSLTRSNTPLQSPMRSCR